MRAILLLLLALPLFGACPTDSGYTKTCFVSLTGNNTTGNGTIGSPFRTVDKAATTAAGDAGTSILLRGGRWTTNSDVAFTSSNMFSCTEASRCMVAGFPGEVVIIDGSAWSASHVMFSMNPGTPTATPPYTGATEFSYWTIRNLRVENAPKQWIWWQAVATGNRIENIWYRGSMGWAIYNCRDCAMTGLNMKIEGFFPGSTISWQGLDFTPVAPSGSRVPWPSYANAVDGHSSQGSPNYYQMQNVTPKWPAYGGNGAQRFLLDSVVAEKEVGNSTDVFGFETGSHVLVNDATFIAPKYLFSSTDAFDLKMNFVTLNNVRTFWGKNGIKLWNKVFGNGILAIHGTTSTTEAALTFGGTMLSGSSCYPASTPYIPIRFAGNDSDGDAYVVIGPCTYGNAPVPGQSVKLADVPGCTSINGEVRVHPTKGTPQDKHLVFILQNLDGSQLSCNAPYDFGSDTLRTYSSVATFTGGGSATITLSTPLIFNTGTWQYPFSSYTNYTNTSIVCTSTGTLPAEITSGTRYYLKTPASASSISITATPQGGTGGSAAITFADAGTGTHTCEIRDDLNSYGPGKMTPPTSSYLQSEWGSELRNTTAMSRSYIGISAAENTTLSDYAGKGFPYKFNGVIAYVPRAQQKTATLVRFGGVRAISNSSDDYIYVSDYDATAMANDARVAFRTDVVPPALGMPSQISLNTEYYIINTDASGKRFQISLTSGGSAVDIGSVNGGHMQAVVHGYSRPYLEVDSLSGMTADSTTFFFDPIDGTQLPYPFETGTTYTVSSTSTVSVNGTNVFLITVHNGGADIEHTSSTNRITNIVMNGSASSGDGIRRGGYTQRVAGTGNNIYYTTGASTHVNRLYGDPSFPGAVANTAELQGLEDAYSAIADPAIDTSTGRATSSSPASMFNKGYYNAFHKLISKADTTAIIYNKFPAPCRFEDCTLVVDDDADMLSPVETITITSGGQDQYIKVGETTPLTANTTYYYGWQQGYDTGGTSFTTDATLSGTGTLTNYIGPIVTSASVAYGLTPSLGTAGDTETTCASNCSLITTGIPKGTYYYQVTHDGVADAIKLVTIKE